jgi:hypothetical protein
MLGQLFLFCFCFVFVSAVLTRQRPRATMSLLTVVTMCWKLVCFIEESFIAHFVWLQYTERLEFYCEKVPQYVKQDISCVL